MEERVCPDKRIKGSKAAALYCAGLLPHHNLGNAVYMDLHAAHQVLGGCDDSFSKSGCSFGATLEGGVIGVGQGLVDAYETGSGSVLLRAKVQQDVEMYCCVSTATEDTCLRTSEQTKKRAGRSPPFSYHPCFLQRGGQFGM
eukprot:1160786-Pelagomonas_calceolata.AAC.12